MAPLLWEKADTPLRPTPRDRRRSRRMIDYIRQWQTAIVNRVKHAARLCTAHRTHICDITYKRGLMGFRFVLNRQQ